MGVDVHIDIICQVHLAQWGAPQPYMAGKGWPFVGAGITLSLTVRLGYSLSHVAGADTLCAFQLPNADSDC